MSEAFIFVSRHRAQEGKSADLPALAREYAAFVRSHEPDALGYHAFTSEDGTELTQIHLYPDAGAMDHHLKVAHEWIGQAALSVETIAITVLGTPGPVLGEALRANEEAGVPVTVTPRPVAGFKGVA
ncbi:antibiotic biosynthesis monooxygenase [Nonomuraea cavernae]|uniref:ABM domain-containing protein n=1 Tax=Nonomuraea cavernae TaxID=2045107 RepID=A0A918DNX8_9ACTN|nr:antibiotic biosynthesis monooxygenase [Nonomuraea cavernae]MCA2188923.1 hypothetical protein [Nonomuraea cavernae]GGO75530.1 hypothetical protein GCM10012289_50820 [Nonomuraea cavernae]